MRTRNVESEEKINECAKVLIEFRQENKYTQDDMAALLGIAQGTISAIEHRKKPLTVKNYNKIMGFCQNYDMVTALQIQCYHLIKETMSVDDLKLIQAFVMTLKNMKKTGGMY